MLLRRHHDRVFALCRRITGNDADAADAAQEALIAIVRGLPRFDGRSQFSTWAYRVATNAALDELRRRSRRPVAALPDPVVAAPDDPAAAVTARIDVDAGLATLPPEFRAAVVLRDLLGMDYAEIAEVLEVPIGTVRSRISRGRTAMVGALGGNSEAGDGRPMTDR